MKLTELVGSRPLLSSTPCLSHRGKKTKVKPKAGALPRTLGDAVIRPNVQLIYNTFYTAVNGGLRYVRYPKIPIHTLEDLLIDYSSLKKDCYLEYYPYCRQAPPFFVHSWLDFPHHRPPHFLSSNFVSPLLIAKLSPFPWLLAF